MSSDLETVSGLLRNGRPLNFKLFVHNSFECHGNPDDVKKKSLNAHHTFSSPENTGSSLEVLV